MFNKKIVYKAKSQPLQSRPKGGLGQLYRNASPKRLPTYKGAKFIK